MRLQFTKTERASSAESVRVPWTLSESLLVLLLCFLVYFLGSFGFLSVLVSAGSRKLYDQHTLLFEIAVYQVLVLCVVVAVVWLLALRYRLPLLTLGFRFPGWKTLLGSAALFPVIVIAINILVWLFNTFVPGYHIQGNSREILQGSSSHIGIGTEILVLLWAAIEAPLTEETLFRGILYQGMRDFFDRRLPYGVAIFLGALFSGLLFGVAHLEPHTLPILALLGAILAYIFQMTRSIYASALIHGIINAGAVLTVFHSAS